MSRNDPIKRNDEMFSQQLTTFASVVGGYATTPLNLDPGDVTGEAADAEFFAQTLANCAAAQNQAREWMVYKDSLRYGPANLTAPAPVALILDTTKAAVPWGLEGRFRTLRKGVLNNKNTNDAINTALGLLGSEKTPVDLTTIQPLLTLRVVGLTVMIDWGFQGESDSLDMICLQVDRGDGKGFVLLAMDTTPGYTDTMPFPSTPAKWIYRGIYYVKDQPVGQWSPTVSVMVGT